MSQQNTDTLAEWIDISQRGYTCRVQVIRQIYEQLKKCHRERSFCETLSPETVHVDVTGNVTPIRWVEKLHLQNEQDLMLSQKQDIFEFGCLIYFIFTDGEYPFGSSDGKNRDIFTSHGLYDLDSCDDESIRRLIASMIQQSEGTRPTVLQLEDMHPIFWTDQRCEEYLNDFLVKFNNAVGSSGSITDDETFHSSLKQVYVRPDNDAIKNKSITERNKWKTPLITTSCWKILDYMKCGKEGRGLRDWLTVYPSVASAVFLAELKRNEPIIKNSIVERKGSLIINAKPYYTSSNGILSLEFYHGRLDDDYVQVFENDDSEFLKWWQTMRRLRKNPYVLSCLDYFIPKDKTSNTWFGASEPFQESLVSWMEESNKDFSLAETKGLLRQIVKGLEFIHSSGLIHGNLTENNIAIFNDKSRSDGPNTLDTECNKTKLTVKVAKLPWKTTAIPPGDNNRHDTQQSCKNDVRALGAIVRKVLEKFKHLNAVLARHLVQCLTNECDGDVPETAAILYHPFFWSEYTMAGFFTVAYRFYANKPSAIGSDVLDQSQTHYPVVEAAFSEAKMKFSNVHRDILQAFENKFQIYEKSLGQSNEVLMENQVGSLCLEFCNSFPHLAILTWTKLQAYKKNSDYGINDFYTPSDYNWPKYDDIMSIMKDSDGRLTVATRSPISTLSEQFYYPLEDSKMQEILAVLPRSSDSQLSNNASVDPAKTYLKNYMAEFEESKDYRNGRAHCLKHDVINRSNKWTALHLTSLSDQLSKYTKRLLKAKADPDCKSESGHTPLHIAAMFNSSEIVSILISYKADVNVEDNWKETPLFKAVTFGTTIHPALVLLKNNADPKKRNDRGESALHKAVLSGSVDMVEFVLQKFGEFCGINEPDANGVSPISLAIATGNINVIRLLISKGADTNARFLKKNFTYPIHYAIIALQHHPTILIEVIMDLLKLNCSLEQKDYLGRTPLHYATIIESQELRSQIVELILEKVRQNCIHQLVNECDKDGLSILHLAVAFSADDIVKKLIAFENLNVNAKVPSSGLTSLHYAALLDNEEIARLLLEKGAKVDEFDAMQESPLHFASAVGSLRVAKLLVNRNKPSVNEDAKDTRSSPRRTPLHLAVMYGNLDMAKLLIENGAKIHARDKLYFTPLHYAECHGHKKIIQLLEDEAKKLKKKTDPSSMQLKPKDCTEYAKLVLFLPERKNLLPSRTGQPYEPIQFLAKYDETDRLPPTILQFFAHERRIKVQMSHTINIVHSI